MGGYSIVAQTIVDVKKRFINMGKYEFKRAKIDVKTSIVLQFLLRLSMWCHFNGMWIMEGCAYQMIWTLKNLKWLK